jgi:glucose/arabinose dehydrogenase
MRIRSTTCLGLAFLAVGLGRVRDIKTGPDGLLYVALELPGHPGRIVRLVPVP